MTDSTQAAAEARTQGQWLWARSTFGPRKAVIAAAASGSAGISQSSGRRSNMALLFAVLGFQAGRRQRGRRLGPLRRRQRLLVHDRLLARLAQLLPQAHVERALPAEEHED